MFDSITERAVRRELDRLRVVVDGTLSEGTTARLERGSNRQLLSVVHDPDLALQLVRDQSTTSGLLVLSEQISPRTSTELRRSGVNYVDAAGNAYLSFGEVLIDIRGRRRPPRRDRQTDPLRPHWKSTSPERTRRESGANLFSAGRAQVSFALLCWPWLLTDPLREIATAAQVSPAAVHRAMDLLAKAGYITNGAQRHWIRPVELMDAWLAAYPVGLGSTLRLAEFGGDPDHVRRPHDEDSIFASGESSFNPSVVRDLNDSDQLIRSTTLTLYVERLTPELALVNRWEKSPRPNIYIRQKFWLSPDGSDQPLGRIRSVPALLVIGDLLASDEPRQRELAQVLRRDLDARLRQM